MADHLLIYVHLTEGRYHGAGDWPPSPARLFQALVAAAACGKTIPEAARNALRWFEALPAPTICAPPQVRGQRLTTYVPNNDLDAVGGDPRRIDKLRVSKDIEPFILALDLPLIYAWPLAAEGEPPFAELTVVANRLYRLGRGVDSAWARVEKVDEATLAEVLADYAGTVFRPTPGGRGGLSLACARPGTLASLQVRHAAFVRRFETEVVGRKASTIFRQPPKPSVVEVSYGSPFTSLLLDLRQAEEPLQFAAWRVRRSHELVTRVRDGVAQRLLGVYPSLESEIERGIIGRGVERSPTPRVRFIPLPSIGHVEVDPNIRRLLILVPNDGALSADDIRWAASNLVLEGPLARVLVVSEDDDVLQHYGIDGEARTWETVTPAVLPEATARRRIEPERRDEGAKGGQERSTEEARACAAVAQALRLAGLRERLRKVWVQREPFSKRGERADRFAEDTRFAKERMWHVRLTFDRPVRGPLVLGDGRFLGLGIAYPVRELGRAEGFWELDIVSGLPAEPDGTALARLLRRAVMARVQAVIGRSAALPAFVSGHEARGKALHGHEHLAFGFDPKVRRLWVLAPHRLERRSPRPEEWRYIDAVDMALAGLRELRGEVEGLRLEVRAAATSDEAVWSQGRAWRSRTPYVVTRHTKGSSAHEAVERDVRRECERLGLPEVEVRTRGARGVAGIGLTADVELRFQRAVAGPIVLGRSRHFGGGLFELMRYDSRHRN